jgi:flagellin
MRINTNVMAMNALRYTNSAESAQSKSMQKLSSGLAINSAADDSAGLAISEKMRSQINGLDQASENAQDGISMIQTAEGALDETTSMLQRMRELAVQSANDTIESTDRETIQAEIDQLATEITRISNTTEFNNKTLLNGGMASTTLHIGANEDQNIEFGISAMDASTLGIAADSLSASVATGGDVSSATVTGTAAGLTDENVITVATSENTATNGESTGATTYANIGALNSALGDCSSTNKTLTVSVDGGADQTITFDGNYTTSAFTDWAAAETFINNQLTGATVDLDDAAGFEFTSSSTGSASSVAVTDTDSLTGALTETSGEDATYSLALTDTDGHTGSVTGLAIDATTASITTGDFSGLTMTLDGALADSQSSDITLDISTAAAAVIAADGSVEEAVTSAGIDMTTQETANAAISVIDTAINTVSGERGTLGAIQNRLEYAINNMSTTSENLTAAESRIRDVDMAEEMMNYTKISILQQASQAMLAQANQLPQSALQLLQ